MFTILTATSSRTLAATRRSRKPYGRRVMMKLRARIAARYPGARVVIEGGVSEWSMSNRQIGAMFRE